jgi:ABC-type uncharacterized transport system ATPase subunit
LAAVLELRQFNKFFGPLQALKNFNFYIEPGEIVGLIGENGAGKSTAMNIAYGLYPADSGQLLWQGQPVTFASPTEARQAGIGMVHQHFKLSLHHSVLENILISEAKKPFGWIDRKSLQKILATKARELGFDEFPWTKNVGDLSVGQQQQLEIFKALLHQPKVLILDEPTAVLTPQEVTQFFNTLKKFKQAGTAVVIITHKLKEIINITDRVYVMRHGCNISTARTQDSRLEDLAAAMIGQKSLPLASSTNGARIRTNEILKIQNLSVEQDGHILDIQNFGISRGEVVGLAGVEGNGQDLLIRALLEPRSFKNLTGRIEFLGSTIERSSTADILKLGLRALPEDRLKLGILPQRSALENFILGHQRQFSTGGLLRWKVASTLAQHAFKKFDVRPLSLELPLDKFSGGNQQKVVVARELFGHPQLLIAAHPTRGVDLHASAFLRQQIGAVAQTDAQTAAQAGAVLVISSDLDELFEMCDRILVIYKGRIQKEFNRGQFSEEKIGAAMAGITQ